MSVQNFKAILSIEQKRLNDQSADIDRSNISIYSWFLSEKDARQIFIAVQ